MTLTIDLTPELETRLRGAAEQRGVPAEQYVLDLIKEDLAGPEARLSGHAWWTSTPEEWMREFDAWSQSHDPAIPPLPDEAVSRESFYEGRL